MTLLRCAAIFSLLLAAACSRPQMPENPSASQIVGLRQITTGGVTYQVARRTEGQNRFRVTTVGGRPGSKNGAAAAVIQAYGCQRAQVTEIEKSWRVVDAVGTFCSNRNWLPLR
ncbi:MAG TPA: hypothetical protein VKN76_12065 [Kiloniellaceae bacterium]|nr:hypothetical protein [Kiloniellaceae bacterium]